MIKLDFLKTWKTGNNYKSLNNYAIKHEELFDQIFSIGNDLCNVETCLVNELHNLDIGIKSKVINGAFLEFNRSSSESHENIDECMKFISSKFFQKNDNIILDKISNNGNGYDFTLIVNNITLLITIPILENINSSNISSKNFGMFTVKAKVRCLSNNYVQISKGYDTTIIKSDIKKFFKTKVNKRIFIPLHKTNMVYNKIDNSKNVSRISINNIIKNCYGDVETAIQVLQQ